MVQYENKKKKARNIKRKKKEVETDGNLFRGRRKTDIR